MFQCYGYPQILHLFTIATSYLILTSLLLYPYGSRDIELHKLHFQSASLENISSSWLA